MDEEALLLARAWILDSGLQAAGKFWVCFFEVRREYRALRAQLWERFWIQIPDIY